MSWKRAKSEPPQRAGATSEPGTGIAPAGDRPEAKVRRALLQLREGAFLPQPDHSAGSAALGAGALGAGALGAGALGSLAIGACALGAVAVGAFAIGRLSVGRARIGEAEIGRLRIGRLEVDAFVPAGRRMR
ncbi:hypothetical protein [Jiella sonneratiae]|uniref:Uncharacterized protein n=1 Tax=Jiella sonneratiae TaxID=2816856 RepID=A0ABS3J2T5_9HYPH|nr:hypothetical protein [Jiella sonneratiae]MBO0903975.1 hypothetical protein [Jiella sonneratiae]